MVRYQRTITKMDTAQKTLWVGNLPDNITEELLYELFLQAGPLERVHVPKEKRYGFIQFKHEESVPYSLRIMDGISVYGKTLNMRARTGSTHDNPSPARQSNWNPHDNRRGGENNNQNRGSSPYDNSQSRNYDQYEQNANTMGNYGNNSKNYSMNRQQPWQKGMPHQILPNMQPSSGHRNHRRHHHDGHHDGQSSRSSHSGDYKSNYRHEPYRRY